MAIEPLAPDRTAQESSSRARPVLPFLAECLGRAAGALRRRRWRREVKARSAEYLSEASSQGPDVSLLELAEFLEDEPLLDRGEDGLRRGRRDEPGFLPSASVNSPNAGRGRI
jgi:hypothetical protein